MALLKRFPSYSQIVRGAAETFRRFPLTLLSAFVGTFAALWLIDQNNAQENPVLMRILITAALGLPWFTALTCLAERLRWDQTRALVLQAAGLALLVVYYFTLPVDITVPAYPLLRFGVLAVGLLFLAAFLPFLQRGATDGFWQYNKALFLRFLLAALFSAVMYVGLVIALAAADHLFGLNVKTERYPELWVLIVGVFLSWIFLAGIPRPLHEMNETGEYPKGLKVFAQFILLPLVGLYFVILFAYEIKIIIEWNWPKGWVSQLVLWYAVVGILSMLLLHPLRERAENRWINRFSTWYFRAMLPLTVMLFLAIVTRIKDYGITENRYFVLALAVGLSVVVLYFIFSRKRDIRVIPIVICALALVSAYGPWSAFAVSERSQVGRLETMLEANGLMTDGSITERTGGEDVPEDTRREMSNIIGYLCTWHGTGAFEGLLSDSLLDEVAGESQYARPEKIARLFGFEPIAPYLFDIGGKYFSLYAAPERLFTVAGYEYLAEYRFPTQDGADGFYALGEDTLRVRLHPDRAELDLKVTASGETVDTMTLPLTETIRQLTADSLLRQELPADKSLFEVAGEHYSAKVVLRELSGYIRADALNVSSTNLLIFVRRIEPQP